MKTLLFACLAAAAFCGAPALAADMAVKAPPQVDAAPSDPWTGFYVGGSIGGRWSDSDWHTVSNSGGAVTGFFGPNSTPLNSSSLRFGGYTGYNLKIAPVWLVGVEADIASAHNDRSTTPGFPGFPVPVGLFGFFVSGPGDVDAVKLGWDGSVRGRLGYLVNPTWLVYGTGGEAWQRIQAISTCSSLCPGGSTGTTSGTKSGWTVGGGVETALSTHWFVRVEYRYADFGHVNNQLPAAGGLGNLNSIIDNIKTNTVLLGTAYKF
jgi:outer membrane immunogenic protein